MGSPPRHVGGVLTLVAIHSPLVWHNSRTTSACCVRRVYRTGCSSVGEWLPMLVFYRVRSRTKICLTRSSGEQNSFSGTQCAAQLERSIAQ